MTEYSREIDVDNLWQTIQQEDQAAADEFDLTDEKGFAFGRFISDSIERNEGVLLVALHSEDARRDHQLMERRGIENQGIVDFSRIARRLDGSEEEAHLDNYLVKYVETKEEGIRIPASYAGNTIIEIYPEAV